MNKSITQLIEDGALKHFSMVSFYHFLKKHGEAEFVKQMSIDTTGYARICDIVNPKQARKFHQSKYQHTIKKIKYFDRDLFHIEEVKKLVNINLTRGRPKKNVQNT